VISKIKEHILNEENLQEGAYTCLEKPIDIDRLLSLLALIKEQKARGALTKPQ
jgi:BarA-like signal transduction histidine kinase